MEDNQWLWSTELEIPSEHGSGEGVVRDVLSQLERLGWIEQDMFGVHLALEEAMVNAIKHGNGMDVSKRVHVICKISAARIWMEVSDEGEGFDLAEIPDPTEDENLDRDSGRGILLMISFMSPVKYNERGNCVTMEKFREGE